jgi:hypothetical protein
MNKLIYLERGMEQEKVKLSTLSFQKQKREQQRGFSPQCELYRPSDRRLSAKLVPTLADRECRVVSATIPHDC